MKMIRVVAKLEPKNKETDKLIEEVVKQMISRIPIKVGKYWMYGKVPVEFIKEIEDDENA